MAAGPDLGPDQVPGEDEEDAVRGAVFPPMLPDDENNVAGPGTFDRIGELGDVEGIDGLVVGLRGVILERLVVEHQTISGLPKPPLRFRPPGIRSGQGQDRQDPKASDL